MFKSFRSVEPEADTHIFSPMYIATSRSDMIILGSLLKDGAERGYSRNALQMAAIHDHHSSLGNLVDAGVDTDINIDRDIGTNPFHAAVSKNHGIVVQVLLERGALIAMGAEAHRGALHKAIALRYFSTPGKLLEYAIQHQNHTGSSPCGSLETCQVIAYS